MPCKLQAHHAADAFKNMVQVTATYAVEIKEAVFAQCHFKRTAE